MRYNTLGSTDIRVSVVAMGCWSIAGGQTWGPQEESDSVAAIEASLEAGVNFFDTADRHQSQPLPPAPGRPEGRVRAEPEATAHRLRRPLPDPLAQP